MAGEQSSGGNPAGSITSAGAARPGPGYWFPLLVFGVLIAVSVPLYAGGQSIGWYAYSPLAGSTPYLLGGRDGIVFAGGAGSGLPGIAEGWYWIAALVTGIALTAAWYHRPARRQLAPGRGYLVVSLALTALAAVLPLLTWNLPLADWLWLVQLWDRGVFALPVIAVGLWLIARRARSRALWFSVSAYTVLTLIVAWPAVQRSGAALTLRLLASAGWHPLQADGTVLLPALALLVPAVTCAVPLAARLRGAANG